MNNKYVLESLAMDLKRVAIGNHRKSYAMANKFYEEATKRIDELNVSSLKKYLLDILDSIKKMRGKDPDIISEQALMYSTLIQNYTQKFV